jgi:hypothetical protein
MIFGEVIRTMEPILLWGLVATVAMTSILYGSQGLGLSRLSLPFLVGTFFSGNRDRAVVVGFIVYTIGGWLFAVLYAFVFVSVGFATWWLGGILGLLHAVFLLVVILPVLPHVHPRMATEYDGARASRRLEPPGFMGLNYGRRTPLTTLLGQTCYGIILGAFYPVPG